jgi:hypothetical protein
MGWANGYFGIKSLIHRCFQNQSQNEIRETTGCAKELARIAKDPDLQYLIKKEKE